MASAVLGPLMDVIEEGGDDDVFAEGSPNKYAKHNKVNKR